VSSHAAPIDNLRGDRPAVWQRLREGAGDFPLSRVAALAVLIGLFAILSPVFLTSDNFQNIGRQTAVVSILAVGMTLVIIAGQIDLSVGSLVALTGMIGALTMEHASGGGMWLGVAAALAAGGALGLVNGLLTARLAIPSFLVTLGMLQIARGIALMVTGTAPVLIPDTNYATTFGDGTYFGIPAPIVWTAVAVFGGYLILARSVFGQRIFATGGNSVAARFSGVRTKRVTVAVFVISGLCAGLAGVVTTARFHAARPDIGAGLELDAIAAVILGGTSLFGGKGTIAGTIVGSLIIGVVNNGLNLMGVSSALQLAIKGAIIIGAVAFQKR
jgi:ribose/xylose/arabinose/galactoside ABC-type transport system permease subunit